MKRMFTILLISMFVACAGTNVPAWLTWHYDYQTTSGTQVDTNDIQFEIYIGDSTSFYFWATTLDTVYYLLSAESLYVDSSYYFYVKAKRLSNNTYSNNSDTAKGFFPVLEPGRPYQLEFINVK